MKKFKVLTIILLLVSTNLLAQKSGATSNFQPTVNYKGYCQMYFSTAQSTLDETPYGFMLRRLRFYPYGQFSKNLKWGFQLGMDKQVFSLVDVFLDYKVRETFNIKIGQFAAPGARSGAFADDLFSTTKLNLMERSTVTQTWNGKSGLKGYRALGVQFYGTFAKKKLYYAVMLSNPVTTGLFTPSIKNPTYAHADNGLAFWGRLEFKPIDGMALGGFYGTSSARNYNTTTNESEKTDRSSYGAHITYLKDGIGFMTEYIAGEVNDAKYNGFFAEASYAINKKIGPAVRYEFFTPNDGNPDVSGIKKNNNITLGLNYYPGKNIKIQANYVLKGEDMADGLDEIDNNIFYFQVQFTYNSKKKKEKSRLN